MASFTVTSKLARPSIPTPPLSMTAWVLRAYGHETVNHSAKEYVRDEVTANGIESVFAVMKRGIYGIYHHVTPKHLHRYAGEFSFRLNDGKVAVHTLDRLDSFIDGVAGNRLTCKGLIA